MKRFKLDKKTDRVSFLLLDTSKIEDVSHIDYLEQGLTLSSGYRPECNISRFL